MRLLHHQILPNMGRETKRYGMFFPRETRNFQEEWLFSIHLSTNLKEISRYIELYWLLPLQTAVVRYWLHYDGLCSWSEAKDIGLLFWVAAMLRRQDRTSRDHWGTCPNLLGLLQSLQRGRVVSWCLAGDGPIFIWGYRCYWLNALEKSLASYTLGTYSIIEIQYTIASNIF